MNWHYKITSSNNHMLTNELYQLPFLEPIKTTQEKIINYVEVLLSLYKRLTIAHHPDENHTNRGQGFLY